MDLVANESDWVVLARGIAWPVVALVAIIAFLVSARHRFWIENIAGRLKRVKAFNVELELSEKVAREVRGLTQDAFSEWRKRIQAEFDRKVLASPVMESLRLVTDSTKDQLSPDLSKDLRATIHVPDPLFAGMLYQLTDYYPAQRTGGGRGRTNSERFGIVGLAWRSRETQVAHQVPTDPYKLVREWGMTPDEARSAGAGRQSFLAHLLEDDNGRAVGILYMDAQVQNVFNPELTIVDHVKTQVASRGLAKAVAELSYGLNVSGPFIELGGAG